LNDFLVDTDFDLESVDKIVSISNPIIRARPVMRAPIRRPVPKCGDIEDLPSDVYQCTFRDRGCRCQNTGKWPSGYAGKKDNWRCPIHRR